MHVNLLPFQDFRTEIIRSGQNMGTIFVLCEEILCLKDRKTVLLFVGPECLFVDEAEERTGVESGLPECLPGLRRVGDVLRGVPYEMGKRRRCA